MGAPINDGGPAFPFQSPTNYCANEGITARDYFAALANENDIESSRPVTYGEATDFRKEKGFSWSRQWARYQHADAMLTARKNEGGTIR